MQRLLMPALTTPATPIQEIVDMLTPVVKGAEPIDGTLLPAPLVIGATA